MERGERLHQAHGLGAVFGTGQRRARVEDHPGDALGVVQGVVLSDEAAVRVAQQEHLGDAEVLDQRSEEPAVAGPGVAVRVGGQVAGGAGADRLRVDDRQMPLQRGHAQVLPDDARSAGVRDAHRTRSVDVIALHDSVDLDGVRSGGQGFGRRGGHGVSVCGRCR